MPSSPPTTFPLTFHSIAAPATRPAALRRAAAATMKDRMLDANFPRDAEGRTYHVGTKAGEVANRVITVGDYTRARRIAASFDGGKALFEHESHRKFLTLTGTYQGTPITVVAIGMGFSVVDFFVRECRAVVQGDMVIVRLGSCGSLSERAPIGSVVVPYESVGVSRNYDAFLPTSSGEQQAPYTITQPLPCDRAVHDALLAALETIRPPRSNALFGGKPVQALGGTKNASADRYVCEGEKGCLGLSNNRWYLTACLCFSIGRHTQLLLVARPSVAPL